MPLATEESKKSVSKPTLLSLTLNSLSGKKPIGGISIPSIFLVAVAMYFIDPRMWRWGIVFSSSYLASWLALFLWLFAIQIARQSTLQRALEGRYEDALQMNRWFSWVPGFGGTLEFWILLEAGRYGDLLAATKPRAFDRNGLPKLPNWKLYYHAMALSHRDRCERAQEILEAANRLAPQFVPEVGFIQVGLADCLLEQNKDPEQARSLLSYTLAKWPESIDPNRRKADLALRKGRHAWALARCARRDKALWQMWHASEESDAFMGRDRAWSRYYAGEMSWALGDTEEALAAFEEASALHPHGQLMLRAQERLSKLRESVSGL